MTEVDKECILMTEVDKECILVRCELQRSRRPDKSSYRVDLGELTHHNLKQLKVINQTIFPVSYNDKFYKDLLEMKDLVRLAYFNDIVVGAVCCRVDHVVGDTGSRRLVDAEIFHKKLDGVSKIMGENNANAKKISDNKENDKSVKTDVALNDEEGTHNDKEEVENVKDSTDEIFLKKNIEHNGKKAGDQISISKRNGDLEITSKKVMNHLGDCGGECAHSKKNSEHSGESSLKKIYIMTLGCLAPYRQLGVGRVMLDHVLAVALRENVDSVYLHVQVNNEDALAFYKKSGFEVVQRAENYYKRIEPADAFVLEKKIIHSGESTNI